MRWNKNVYVETEEKSNQWFGATVKSSGENGVIVVSLGSTTLCVCVSGQCFVDRVVLGGLNMYLKLLLPYLASH